VKAAPAGAAARRSASFLGSRQPLEPARGLVRSELPRALVPGTGLRQVRREPEHPELHQKGLVEGGAKRERGLGVAGIGRPPQGQPGRGDIAALEEILAALDQHRDLIGIEGHECGSRWFASGGERRP
jgi:hypothetical protein